MRMRLRGYRRWEGMAFRCERRERKSCTGQSLLLRLRAPRGDVHMIASPAPMLSRDRLRPRRCRDRLRKGDRYGRRGLPAGLARLARLAAVPMGCPDGLSRPSLHISLPAQQGKARYAALR